MNKIKLTHRKDGDTLYFLPETWTRELKPHSKAKWTVTGAKSYMRRGGTILLVQDDTYIHTGLLYLIIKEMDCPQAKATITPEGLQIESLEGLRQRVLLKWQRKPTKTTEVLHMERN